MVARSRYVGLWRSYDSTNGRLKQVATYEVLVMAAQPIRYMLSNVPHVELPTAKPDDGLKRLKYVVLLSSTLSDN